MTAYALRGSDLWTSSSAGLERWRVGGTAPELLDAIDVQPYAGVVAANGALVAAARGNTVGLAVNDARLGWQATEPLSVCDEVVALYPAAQSVWVVGERHVSRVALTDAGPRVASTFELVAREGSIYARPLAGPACGGAEAPEPVLAASASGNVLALALRRTVVTLDLEYPSRLPTFGAQASGDDVTGITARAGFVYATTTTAPAGLIWRLGPRHPFVAVSATPAPASIDGRQYSGRRAARLSGTVLTVAWW